MEYLIGGIIVITGVIGVFLFCKISKQKEIAENTKAEKQNIAMVNNKTSQDKLNQFMIQVEQLPAEVIRNEGNLIEITDGRVLAYINNFIPELFQGVNTVQNAVHAVQSNAQVLYQAIIPAGAKLANSKDMPSAFRGFYKEAERNIQGHANLVAIEQNVNVATNIIASAMGIASMVVGQYYMTQIYDGLDKINTSIRNVIDFQDNEYKSKVFALVAQIQRASTFQVNVLENDELRMSEIDNLNRWEQECIELLGQANLTIQGLTDKKKFDYVTYEKVIEETQKWFVYQKTLVEVLKNIAELRHALYLGTVSREQCSGLFLTYSNQVQTTLEQLSEWHQDQIQKFGINVSNRARKRKGFNKVIYYIPARFNPEYQFCSIPDKTVDKILTQTKKCVESQRIDKIDLFQEDVRIIAKQGKVYYLPKDNLQEA